MSHARAEINTQSSSSRNPPDNETFKILLATDIHLGYEERSAKKTDRHDSFTTFEEILQIAIEKRVDFMLLAGDLFHDSKPSQNTVLECINLLRKYCLDDRPINFKIITNPVDVLSNSSKTFNYENENLNIGLPIFTIHGNHDNPSFNYTGTLDILVASGLVNYFAKLSDLTKITVTPIIIKKNGTYIAIYGISYIGEQRLSRLFSQELVTFLRPNFEEKCFNILVIHQNRAQHTRHGYLAENKLPEFFDLIFWGHEHECRLIPEEIAIPSGGLYHITQPGSSVATSLSEGEAKEKHVGILKVHKTKFTIEPVKLKTVRPFVYDSVYLSKIIDKEYCCDTPEGLAEYCDDYIEHTMLEKVRNKLLTGHPKQPTLPLIRLKIFYADESQKFDTMLITRKYCDKVANPNDMILFAKERSAGNKSSTLFDGIDEDSAVSLAECFRHNEEDKDWSFAVQNGIKTYFQSKNYKFKILSMVGLNESLERCVKANDDDALYAIIQHQMEKTLHYFEGKEVPLDDAGFQELLEKFRRERSRRNPSEEIDEVQEMLDNPDERARLRGDPNADIVTLSDGEAANNDGQAVQQASTTTRARGRGSRGPRARGAARGARGSRGSRGVASVEPLNVSTASPATNRSKPTQSGNRVTQSNVRFTSAQARKPPSTQQSQYENIDFSDSD